MTYSKVLVSLVERFSLNINEINFNSEFENPDDFNMSDFFVWLILAIMDSVYSDNDWYLVLNKQFNFKNLYEK